MQPQPDTQSSPARASKGGTSASQHGEPAPQSPHPNHPLRRGSLVTPAVKRVIEWHEQHSRPR